MLSFLFIISSFNFLKHKITEYLELDCKHIMNPNIQFKSLFMPKMFTINFVYNLITHIFNELLL